MTGAVKPEASARSFAHTINEIGNGVRICELDTVQSQANRMEASYRGELAGVIPRHMVEAGGHRADLTELSHRIGECVPMPTAPGASNARENTEWPVTGLTTISCTAGTHRGRLLARSSVKADLRRKNNSLLNLHRIE